ncbi:hypothetical protein [Luteimonas sp. gir]|uniref:hypothetical protein n=1 Tax=Luteimonas sp. gir TaxID=3127960 RepID=UPI003075BD1B
MKLPAVAESLNSIDWPLTLSTIGSAAASAVMPIATLVLAIFTVMLARETRRMARATERTEVTVTIEPNQWGMMYFDIWVANTGNRAAYEVSVEFDPPLVGYERADSSPPPLQRISVMRPGQTLRSFLGNVQKIEDQRTKATVTWRVGSATGEVQRTQYAIDFDFIRNHSMLGENNPIVQIAKEVKHIREDWKSIARGQRRIQADQFTAADRKEAQRLSEEKYRAIK